MNRSVTLAAFSAFLKCLTKVDSLESGEATTRGTSFLPSVLENLRQEGLGAIRVRPFEEVCCGRGFDDLAAIHEEDVVRDLPREAHLVCDAEHGHALAGELGH